LLKKNENGRIGYHDLKGAVGRKEKNPVAEEK